MPSKFTDGRTTAGSNPNDEFAPLAPWSLPPEVLPAPPAPTVTVYDPAADDKVLSRVPPPPVASPRTELL